MFDNKSPNGPFYGRCSVCLCISFPPRFATPWTSSIHWTSFTICGAKGIVLWPVVHLNPYTHTQEYEKQLSSSSGSFEEKYGIDGPTILMLNRNRISIFIFTPHQATADNSSFSVESLSLQVHAFSPWRIAVLADNFSSCQVHHFWFSISSNAAQNFTITKPRYAQISTKI